MRSLQVLQPLRPCMRIVASTAELKSMLKRSLALMEEVRVRDVQHQAEEADRKLQEFVQRRNEAAARDAAATAAEETNA